MTTSQRPLTRLIRYAAAYRWRIGAASMCSVLNKLVDLAPPVLIGLAVDVVVEQQESWLGQLGVVEPWYQLLVVGVLTVLIWGLESVFEYAFQWLWRNLAQTIQHDLRLETYGHVQQLEMAWFQERSTGRLMSILNDDVNQLERFLDGGANELLQVATTVVVISGIFFWFSPGVAVLSLAPVPIILWASFRFQARIAPRYSVVREQASQVNGQLSNNLAGIETIKSFTAEAFEMDRVGTMSERYRLSNRHAISLSSAFSPLIRMAIVVGFTATLLYGGWLTLEGSLAVGSYSVLVFMTQRLLWPLTRLGTTFDLYQRAMASTTRILNLLHTPVGIVSGPVRLSASEVGGAIRFRHVHFAYPGREPILKDFNLDIPAKKTVAVVGPTGSGKSTLVRLLLRFFDAESGVVELDGVDIRQLNLADLRDCVGLVSQSMFLFSGSVTDNVAYGVEGARVEDVVDSARLAEAHEFVSALPDGYDTWIGERGQKLSGGQRQRLCLARAFQKSPPVLVLDEATSAVDNETEAAIQRSLKRVGRERTMLIIAHRLSTIRHADHIVVLDEGQIVEEGTHHTLVSRGGLYSRLWNVQTGQQDGEV